VEILVPGIVEVGEAGRDIFRRFHGVQLNRVINIFPVLHLPT
jgi:hypothetical protein